MTAPTISADNPAATADEPAGHHEDRPIAPAAGRLPQTKARHPVAHPAAISRREMPWRFELFLAFCSAWVATQLWIWPEQFPLRDTPMAVASGLRGHARVWAAVCVIAALLKLSGLGCRLWTRWIDASTALMLSGLFMSIVIWTVVGTTWEFEFPHSLTPVMLIGGALGAAWQLAQWKPPPRPRA